MTTTWGIDEASATAAIEAAWFLAGDELDRVHAGAGGAPGAAGTGCMDRTDSALMDCADAG